MNHHLPGSRIALSYLQDRRALTAIDWPTVLDDLTDAGVPPGRHRWCDLESFTHVVLAIDRATGHYAGMLGLIERNTMFEPYLLVEAAMIRPGDTGVTLRRAMLAHVLARVVSLDGKPIALASPRGDLFIELALRDLGLNIRGVDLHPPLEGTDGGNVIVFRTASLARRIGPGTTVLDLRGVAEASLLRDLRTLHGGRPERLGRRLRKPDPAPGLTAKSARSAAATRRPRKATHTGRTG